jgi:ubiquinone/menaquinone biosynthesis C-methylase UbiE
VTDGAGQEHEYSDDVIALLELRWGDGFLSPGGAAEVARLLEGAEIAGCEVLDIGCGTGGADVLLVREHGAGHVTGIDLEAPVLERAAARAADSGVSDRLTFRRVEPGALPFPERGFDVIFSKDTIIQVSDKAALYAEVFRVLRPGGLFVLGDWFGGEAPISKETKAWMRLTGLSYHLQTIARAARDLQAAGFEVLRTRDRNAWYREDVRQELAEAKGPKRAAMEALLGDAEAERWIESACMRAVAVEQGHLRPGHIHARRPG